MDTIRVELRRRVLQAQRLRDLAAPRTTAAPADLDRRAQRRVDRMVRQASPDVRPGLSNHRTDRRHLRLLSDEGERRWLGRRSGQIHPLPAYLYRRERTEGARIRRPGDALLLHGLQSR